MDIDYDYRKYARYIYADGVQPHMWKDDGLISTVHRVHDRARAFIWAAEGMEVACFQVRVNQDIPSVGPATKGYPHGFKSNTFFTEYASFLELTFEDEKYSSFWLAAVVLDIYHLSGRILHYLATDRRIMDAQIARLIELCVLTIEAERHETSDSVKNADVLENNDCVILFFEELCKYNGVKVRFKEMLASLETKFTVDTPYIGKSIVLFFGDGQWWVEKGKDRKRRALEMRTLENYYSAAKKIHKTRFCEK